MLDLGCGVGPLGIILQKICPSSQIHMADVDALAQEFAVKNCRINGVTNFSVFGSIGFDQVRDHDFDLIVSNIPAKIGEKALSHFLTSARFFLRKGGKVAIVVIDDICDFIRTQLHGQEDIEVLYEKTWPGHTVFHYRFIDDPSPESFLPGFPEGVYLENSKEPELEGELLCKLLDSAAIRSRSVLCYGLNTASLRKLIGEHSEPAGVALVERNLLRLRQQQVSLQALQVESQGYHAIFPPLENTYDVVLAHLPQKWRPEAYAQLLSIFSTVLKPSGKAGLVLSATTFARVKQFLPPDLSIIRRQKEKGRVSLLLHKKPFYEKISHVSISS